MNEISEIVSYEKEAFGCKVIIIITRPDMALMLDGYGSNVSQEGDGEKDNTPHVASMIDKAYSSCAT